MQFSLIDRITELSEGEHITAIKVLALAEEYLQDHFPRFPVMPGVMIVEAMYQASAWLVRQTEDFAHSMVVLREVRNAKFSAFVKPGQMLIVRSKWMKQTDAAVTFKAEATVEGEMIVATRLVLERYNLADRYPSRAATDNYTRQQLRNQFEIIYDPAEATQGN